MANNIPKRASERAKEIKNSLLLIKTYRIGTHHKDSDRSVTANSVRPIKAREREREKSFIKSRVEELIFSIIISQQM
jgi:hypothetical protein